MNATHFEPNEEAYLVFREMAPQAFCREIERCIHDGVTVAQMLQVWAHEPAHVQEVIGAALAYWVQRAQEEG